MLHVAEQNVRSEESSHQHGRNRVLVLITGFFSISLKFQGSSRCRYIYKNIYIYINISGVVGDTLKFKSIDPEEGSVFMRLDALDAEKDMTSGVVRGEFSIPKFEEDVYFGPSFCRYWSYGFCHSIYL